MARDVKVNIVGDATDLKRALRDAEGAASSAGAGIKDGLTKAALATGAVLAAGEAVHFLGGAVKDAADDQAAQRLFENQVKLAGGSKQATDALNKQIAAGQKLGFTDDELRQALAQTYSQNHSTEQSHRDVSLAMDLARAKGIDLNTALDAVTKAQNGNMKSLKSIAPEYAALIANAGSTTEAMDILSKAVGGQADVWASTSSGQLEIAKQQFGEIKEQIGAALLPVLAKLTDFIVSELIPTISNIVSWMEEHKAIVVAVAAVVAGALVAAFISWASAAAAAAAATIAATAPVLAIGAAVGALAAGLIYAYQHSETFRAVVDGVASFLRDDLWPILKVIGEVALTYLKVQIDIVVGAFKALRAVGETVWSIFRSIVDIVAEFVDWLKKLPELIDKAMGPIDEVIGKVGGVVGKGFKVVGKLNPFADGGIVPGAQGAALPILAHGGEMVLNKGQQQGLFSIIANGGLAAARGNQGGITIPVTVHAGTIVTERQLDLLIRDSVQRGIRQYGPLPVTR